MESLARIWLHLIRQTRMVLSVLMGLAIGLDHAPAQTWQASSSSPPTIAARFPGYQPIYGPYPVGGPPPGSVVTLPDEMPIHLPPTGDQPRDACRQLSDFKDGFFQKASITATWLDRGDQDNVGISELETFFTIAIPAPTRKMPLMISPGFALRALDGPGTAVTPDLPPRLYDVTTEFRWVTMIQNRWGIELAVTPGIYADDLDQWDEDSLRLKARAATLFKQSPTKSFVLGASYLDRNDISMLPIFGVICTPCSDWRYELVFPRSKVARRFTYGPDWDDWIYVAAEFGGDEYSYQSAPGMRSRLTYRDVRVRIGVERKRDGGGGRRIEVGYVFGRELEFDNGLPDYEPDNTLMVRAGFAF